MKLTKEQILEIPQLLEEMSEKELAEKYSVNHRTIARWKKKLRDRGIEVPSYKGSKSILDK